MQIRAANALIHDFLQAPVAFQAALLPPLHEDGDDAGVLTDWSVSLGAHAAVGQNLGDGVLRSRAFLRFIGFAEGAEIGRASCRERVCQYVYISVLAVSLKKTKSKK